MPTLEAQARAIQSRAKNIRFGIARGLTQTANEVAAQVTSDLPAIFDRPTPFTQRAIGFTSATREGLTASVFVRDIQARYLLRQETGGLRTPQPGSPITLPVGQWLNQYGNIARGAIGRARQKPDVFVSKGTGKTKHLPPGLYERTGTRKKKAMGSQRGRKVTTGRGKQQTKLKLLVAFERQAKYQPRFRFVERTTAAVKASAVRNIERSIAEALRTAR